MGNVRPPLLWLSGPSGAGKSTVGWEVFAQLSRDGVRTAFVDADQISLCHPLPEGMTHHLRARNLAAMWPNFQREGARCLVLAGFVHTAEEVRAYTALLPGLHFTACRLRVESTELKERFLARGWRPDLVEHAVAEAQALDHSDYAGLCVPTGGFTVPEAARLVRERAGGWPGDLPAATPRDAADGRSRPPADDAPFPVLWICGATAVGKSTVGYEVFTRIHRTGVRAAYVDVKQIGALRPGADHRTLKARNLAAVWSGHRAMGARCLVVSGEADDPVRGYADRLPGAELTVCRLHAGPETLAERVTRRGRGGGPAIPGDELRGLDADGLHRTARRAAREAEALDREGAGQLRIDTDGRSVQEVAADVLDRGGGWPHLT